MARSHRYNPPKSKIVEVVTVKNIKTFWPKCLRPSSGHGTPCLWSGAVLSCSPGWLLYGCTGGSHLSASLDFPSDSSVLQAWAPRMQADLAFLISPLLGFLPWPPATKETLFQATQHSRLLLGLALRFPTLCPKVHPDLEALHGSEPWGKDRALFGNWWLWVLSCPPGLKEHGM